MVKEIPLQNGMVALVDDEDFEMVSKHTWTVSVTNKGSNLVVSSWIDGKQIKLNRYVLDLKDEDSYIRFFNENKLDFQKKNLTKSEKNSISRNAKSRRSSSSMYKGVSFDKQTNKWRASIRVDGQLIHLGRYSSEDEAAEIYNLAANYHWGDDCFLNNIGADNRAGTHVVKRTFANHRTKNITGFKGVFNREGKLVSRIYFNKKIKHIGVFDSKQEAAKAYDQKAYELFGDKAILNFPELKSEYEQAFKRGESNEN